MQMRVVPVLSFLLLLPAVCPAVCTAAEPVPVPFTYQSAPDVARKGSLQVQTDASVGTRDLRLLGQRGYEQGVRARYGVLPNWQVELFGAGAFRPDGRTGPVGWSAGAGVQGRVWNQADHGVTVRLAASVARDFGAAITPRLTASLERSFGAWTATGSGLAELPLGAPNRRDAVDVVVSAGLARQVLPGLLLGAEAAGQDLEGLWDDEEAEGGARLVAGPMAAWQVGEWLLRAHAGAVWSASGPAQQVDAAPGFLGRVSVALGL